jgi:hypothetical protein
VSDLPASIADGHAAELITRRQADILSQKGSVRFLWDSFHVCSSYACSSDRRLGEITFSSPHCKAGMMARPLKSRAFFLEERRADRVRSTDGPHYLPPTLQYFVHASRLSNHRQEQMGRRMALVQLQGDHRLSFDGVRVATPATGLGSGSVSQLMRPSLACCPICICHAESGSKHFERLSAYKTTCSVSLTTGFQL